MARRAWVFVVLSLLSALAQAGELKRADVARFFPAPFEVGEKDSALPVWPIFKQNATQDELVAYAFESADLAPIPGFSGAPINLLVALSPEGAFVDVKVISQHEPVFVDGLGPDPLYEFVKQYAGKTLKQAIKVGPPGGTDRGDAAVAIVEGVAKATASVRILNESLIGAGLAVARAKLGFAQGRDPSRAARLKPDVYERLDWRALVERGFVRHYTLSNAEAEMAFAGTAAAGLDRDVRIHPEAAFIDLYVGLLDASMVGRNLLDDKTYARLIADLDGRHALMALSVGRQGFMGEDFVEGATPTKLTLSQAGAAVEIRDFAWRKPFAARDMPEGEISVLVIKPQAGWDPATPATLSLRVTRERGQILSERVSHDFGFDFAAPASWFILPAAEETKGALGVWRDRGLDLGLIGLALVALAVALARPRALTATPRRLRWARRLYLAFTLFFIGWQAQAQLSIVTLIGLMRAARGEGALTFLAYDPPSLVLWAFTLASLVVWGRGTFCGWLCPFGALQEFAGDIARALKIKQLRLKPAFDAKLRYVKYAALLAVLGAAGLCSPLAERFAEVEPFKTAITLGFQRSAPFVTYAGGLIVVSMFVYKAYCRYLCPLGAALALVGLVRRWAWIPRRDACGSPCQLCRVQCRYDAIRPSGAVVYSECFQCLDCVAIYHDRDRCAPVVVERRRGRALAIRKAVKA